MSIINEELLIEVVRRYLLFIGHFYDQSDENYHDLVMRQQCSHVW